MFKTVKIIAIIVALVGLIGGSAYIDHLIKENRRLDRNHEILLKEHKSETRSLELDKSELKRRLKAQKGIYTAVVDSLDLKIKQLESLTSGASQTKVKVKTKLKDTTIYVTDTLKIKKTDTVIKYKTFDYQDEPWVYANGKVYNDSIEFDVEVRDTIYAVNYWKRKGWFIFKWFHKKKPHSDITNRNPYVNIKVEQSIKQE